MVDSTPDIVTSSETERAVHPKWLQLFAKFISLVFHPLFIPVYVTLYLLFVHPYLFAGFPDLLKLQRASSIFFNMTFIPGFAVFLMWQLKLIDSLQLKTPKERIIPYASAIIFYFWGWYAMSRQPDNPEAFINFLQGAFFGVCGAWIININSKISMHTTAMGGLIAFMLLFSFTDDHASGGYLSIAILIAGIVGSARFIASDHTKLEINQGYIIGALAQVMAWWI